MLFAHICTQMDLSFYSLPCLFMCVFPFEDCGVRANNEKHMPQQTYQTNGLGCVLFS